MALRLTVQPLSDPHGGPDAGAALDVKAIRDSTYSRQAKPQTTGRRKSIGQCVFDILDARSVIVCHDADTGKGPSANREDPDFAAVRVADDVASKQGELLDTLAGTLTGNRKWKPADALEVRSPEPLRKNTRRTSTDARLSFS